MRNMTAGHEVSQDMAAGHEVSGQDTDNGNKISDETHGGRT